MGTSPNSERDGECGVLICSPIAIYAEGLAVALELVPWLAVLGTAGDGERCLEAVRRRRPAVTLLDLETDGALPLIADLVEEDPAMKVLVLGIQEVESSVIPCAEAGVAGYVTREDSIHDLITGLGAVRRNETHCSPRTAAILLRQVRARAACGPGDAGLRLTRREGEVLRLVGEGLSNKQIAQRLCIELPTVKNHVHHILEKLGARRRTEAVAWLRTAAGRSEIRSFGGAQPGANRSSA